MQNSSCATSSRYFVEFIGTTILVLMGIGSAVLAGKTIGILGIGLAFGLTLMALVYAIGPISGCHVNPAVSLAMFFNGELSLKDTLFYIIAQLMGGIVGAYLVYLLATGKADFSIANGFAANGFAEHSPEKYSLYSVGLVEVLMTTILLLVVLASGYGSFTPGFAGIAIGGTLVAIHLVSLNVSNTSVNFARSLGSAVIAGDWAIHQLWLFASAHVIAAVLAVILFKMMFCRT